MGSLVQPLDWMVLGAYTGAHLLLAVLSLLIASAYRERLLLMHAVASAFAVLALHLHETVRPAAVPAALLGVLAASVVHLRDLTQHVGSLRQHLRWTAATAAILVVLAVADALLTWRYFLPVGLVIWVALAGFTMSRAWSQSQPWAQWWAAGHLALFAACVGASIERLPGWSAIVLGGLLTFWCMAVYLASVWRSRVFGESRWRMAAERSQDPLTGLSTRAVLERHIHSARSLMRRYGHPSSLLLVHVEQLARITTELGAQTGEAAALEAGTRIRVVLGDGDVAARVTPQRFAILCEGSPASEAAANVASRVVVAGLKEELHSVPGLFLHFRVVLAELPLDDVPVADMLERLGVRLDLDVSRARERRIRAIASDELRGLVEPTVPSALQPLA